MNREVEQVVFPVYVLARDCGEVIEFPSRPALEGYLELIDVENVEYEAWDGTGSVLRLSVSRQKSTWLNIVRTEDRVSELEFAVLRKRAEKPRSIRS